MKRFLAALFIVVSVFCLFAGCTDTASTPHGEGEAESTPETPDDREIDEMYITIDGNKLKVTLAENPSADALAERLRQGDITYTASDYGGFEKVGSLGFTLPASDAQITTQAGDVMLYSRNQIVIFYGSNTWAYTRLGKIEGYSASELKVLLGAGKGSLSATISLK